MVERARKGRHLLVAKRRRERHHHMARARLPRRAPPQQLEQLEAQVVYVLPVPVSPDTTTGAADAPRCGPTGMRGTMAAIARRVCSVCTYGLRAPSLPPSWRLLRLSRTALAAAETRAASACTARGEQHREYRRRALAVNLCCEVLGRADRRKGVAGALPSGLAGLRLHLRLRLRLRLRHGLLRQLEAALDRLAHQLLHPRRLGGALAARDQDGGIRAERPREQGPHHLPAATRALQLPIHGQSAGHALDVPKVARRVRGRHGHVQSDFKPAALWSWSAVVVVTMLLHSDRNALTSRHVSRRGGARPGGPRP